MDHVGENHKCVRHASVPKRNWSCAQTPVNFLQTSLEPWTPCEDARDEEDSGDGAMEGDGDVSKRDSLSGSG